MTVRERVAVWVRLPETPVMVIVARPATASPDAVSVRMLPVLVFAGLKDAVTPAGSPLAERATDPVKLLRLVTAIELVALLP